MMQFLEGSEFETDDPNDSSKKSPNFEPADRISKISPEKIVYGEIY
jgi:hypothetical protein